MHGFSPQISYVFIYRLYLFVDATPEDGSNLGIFTTVVLANRLSCDNDSDINLEYVNLMFFLNIYRQTIFLKRSVQFKPRLVYVHISWWDWEHNASTWLHV